MQYFGCTDRRLEERESTSYWMPPQPSGRPHLCIVEVLSALGLSVGNKGSMIEADKTIVKLDYVSIFIHATTGIHRILFAVRTDNSMQLTLKKNCCTVDIIMRNVTVKFLVFFGSCFVLTPKFTHSLRNIHQESLIESASTPFLIQRHAQRSFLRQP